MDNRDYARILEEIAALLQIKGANRFRSRAFENAARTVSAAPEPIEQRIDRGELTDMKGIGEGIAEQLRQIHDTGSCDHHRQLVDELDAGLLDLLDIQGLGPKRIKAIYEQLDICDVGALRGAAEDGAIRELSGFGPKTEQKILDEIDRLERQAGRIPLPRAMQVADSLREQLEELHGVDRVTTAGSVRRGRETIGDIDLLVATHQPAPVADRLTSLVEVNEVLAAGDTKISLRLRGGIQVDVRIVEPRVFGSALHYFTGSKQHHVQLRSLAKQKGLKINEYGVFRIGGGEPIASRSERELFDALQLDYIPPQLREGRGEIERAADGTLPRLIDTQNIRGDLHMHTTETDGRATIEQMARTAASRGYDYIAITDHSRAVRVADGMDAERFAAQIDRVRTLDRDFEQLRILAGIEVDILRDGSLDMDPGLLQRCDWVVASVHSHFQLSAAAMTERLVAAVESGLVDCIGHPTGRILGGRDGYEFDFDALAQAAASHGVALEINGSSGRLDLNAELADRARRAGAPLVLGSDAHSRRGLRDIRFALQQARRAGLEPEHVLNTRGPDELLGSPSTSPT